MARIFSGEMLMSVAWVFGGEMVMGVAWLSGRGEKWVWRGSFVERW